MALDLSGLADELITDLAGGGGYVLVVETGGVEDPITGEYTPGTIFETQIDAAEDSVALSLMSADNVQTGDIVILVSPYTDAPEGCYFKVRGSRYSIIDRMPTYNGGVLQVQKFHLRRS